MIEVVVSVAIFAGAIVVVLGLLGPSLLTTREALDSAVASRIVDSVNMELKRLERTSGFVAIKSGTTAPSEIALYGTQDGSYIVSAGNDPITGAPKGVAPSDRYFRVVIRQLTKPTSSDWFLALNVRVEWPHAGIGGTVVPVEERKSFSFNLGLRP